MVQYRRFQPRQIISGHEITRLSNYTDSLDQRSLVNTTVADGPGDGEAPSSSERSGELALVCHLRAIALVCCRLEYSRSGSLSGQPRYT